jgi:beta-carotene hydroxylase
MQPNRIIKFEPPPRLSEIGEEFLDLTPGQRAFTLAQPFIFAGIYFYAAFTGHWAVAVGCAVYLSFVTYGSTSHDLVHRNQGLSQRANELFLTLIELLAIRSGHAYRMAHLHHHARFPEENDIEAGAAKKSFWGAILDGTTFHFRLWRWALKRSRGHERRLILAEGWAALVLILTSILLCRITPIPIVYVILMITGAWITPLVTSYIPHDPSGRNGLEQTRVFRGKMLSLIAMEHLYHLEHHLYPSVPHQNWPRLAKRLDPYFARVGIKPIQLWW